MNNQYKVLSNAPSGATLETRCHSHGEIVREIFARQDAGHTGIRLATARPEPLPTQVEVSPLYAAMRAKPKRVIAEVGVVNG